MKAVVLTGGVGGAKFVLGLARSGLADTVTAIINTGDDFRHFGLHISPDIDTLLYTLSDRSNLVQGWGRQDETWTFLDATKSLGGADWFALGDGDLALHILRTARLSGGESLSAIIADFARQWGIATTILPMSDDPVETFVDTDEGALPFQHYFVRRQCAPALSGVRFEGASSAHPAPGVIDAIGAADAIFIAPSNPYLSVDPILAVPAIRSALADATAPVVAISPIVGGTAVKGPTAKIMRELGRSTDNETIATHYAGLIDGLVIDRSDSPASGVKNHATHTMMRNLDDKIALAREAVKFAKTLAGTVRP